MPLLTDMRTRISQRHFGNLLPLTLLCSDGPDFKPFNSSVSLPTSGKMLYSSSWVTTIMLNHTVGESFGSGLDLSWSLFAQLDSLLLPLMSSHGHTFAILLSLRTLNAVRNGAAKAEVSVPLSSSFNVVPPLKWCLLRSILQPKSPGILAMTGPMYYLISLRVDALILNPSPLRHEGKLQSNSQYHRCLSVSLAFTTDEHFNV